MRLPVFFWALLSWERGSSTGKAVQTLEETVQVIYFSLQTVCFSSVEKFHPDCPPPFSRANVYLQKDQNNQAGSAVYLAHGAGILSVGLKWWNSEFPFGFVMLWTRWSCQQPTPARSQLGEGACLAALCLQSHPEPPPSLLRLGLTMVAPTRAARHSAWCLCGWQPRYRGGFGR